MRECAKLCSKLGLDFIELNMCLPQFQTENLGVEFLCELSEEYNIYYTIHLDDTNTPCDSNPKISKVYTDTVLETINITKQLNIPILNMHLELGTHFTLPDQKVLLFEEYKETYLGKLTVFRDACQQAIGDSDIKICVENTRAFCHSIGKEILSLLLKSPVFALTFDTGQDASNDFKQRLVINTHIDRLTHMHLHDALSSERKDHLPFGDGELNLLDYQKLADKHNSRIVVEVKTIEGLKKSVQWIKLNT